MRDVFLVEAIRTPIGRKQGALSTVRPDVLASYVLHELMERTGVPKDAVEDVIMGCVSQVGEQANDIARLALLMADFPITVPGVTIDRQCGSSQQAVHFAAQAIASGDMDVVIAAGVESMSRIPMFSSLQGTTWAPELTARYEMIHQGVAAERIAERYELSREALDRFSLLSHQKALKAENEGRFSRERIRVRVPSSDRTEGRTMVEDVPFIWVDKDEIPRPDTSLEKLSQLKPSFIPNGRIHAGNASAIADGASAALLMSGEAVRAFGLKPRFRIRERVVIGSDPTLMLTGPISATERLLQKAKLNITDIDVFEVNEAFASVVLAWQKETGAELEKMNPLGGAIALGHPLGASGTRLFATAMTALLATGGQYALITMCEGLGMANATLIERIEA